MKKILLGMACMLALGAATATAQNNKNCATDNCPRTQCAVTNCPQGRNCPQGPAVCESAGAECCFADLSLTDAQKKQLQELNQNYASKKREMLEQQKTAKAQNDSCKKALRQCSKDLRAQKLADIKKILTPEQYTKFLENAYLNNNGKKLNMRKADGRPRVMNAAKNRFDKTSKFDGKIEKNSKKQ